MNEHTNVQNITDGNFHEMTSTGVSLVDFWAPWCQPCRIQGPILDKVAEQVGEKARIYKLNVDENKNAARIFNVTGIPTLLLFKDGKPVKQFVGIQQMETLVSAIESQV